MDLPQRKARQAEEKTARLHGGRVTPASGSGATAKNDVRNEDWSFEVKSTSLLSYRLREADLLAALKHALVDGRKMAFLIEFSRIFPQKTTRFILMTEDDYLELTGQ